MSIRCYLLVVLCLISPDFATCSLALHKHVFSDVTKSLSIFASLLLSTLASMFRRAERSLLAERSLFAQGHVEMISFFFRVRDIPPRFISLNLIFLDTYWSDVSDFCINTQTVSQSIIFQIFGGQIFFSAS